MNKINKKCNKIIEEYLFNSKQIKELWDNEIFLDLDKKLNYKSIISNKNYDEHERNRNEWNAIKIVGNWLQSNNNYRKIIINNYGNNDLLDNIKLTLTAYAYNLTKNISHLKEINIFTDKRSIIYNF